MTVSTLADPAAAPMLPTLDAAVVASRDAHEAARALTDAVLVCQHLPADIYRYAPDVPEAGAMLTAAARALTTAVRRAQANPTAENLPAVYQAMATLHGATAAVATVTAALWTAAAWYTGALPPASGG